MKNAISSFVKTFILWKRPERSIGRCWPSYYLLTLLLGFYTVCPTTAFGQIIPSDPFAQIIPSERRVDWASYPPGVKGGILTRTNIFCNVVSNAPGGRNAVGDGVTDDFIPIQNAINACPSNEVVYIPAGNFLLSTGLVLKSGITLRGAGSRSTFLVLSNSAAPNVGGSIIRAYASTVVYGFPVRTNNVVSGAVQNSTNILVETADGMAPGVFALVDQANDPALLGDSLEPYGYLSRNNGTRLAGQFVEILSVSNNKITFTPPLAYSYTNSGQITPCTTYYRHIGLEDFCISNALPIEPSGGGANIRFGQVFDSWIQNVSSWKCSEYHIVLRGCFRCVVRDSDVNTSYRYRPSRAYGIDLMNQSTACLVENNYSWMCAPGFITEGSGPWNVWGYNYSAFASNQVDGMMWSHGINHGGSPHMNLWEGNVGNGMVADLFHAGSSYQTIFRNWWKGWEPNCAPSLTNYYQRAVHISAYNYFYNVVGNVLGDPALQNPLSQNRWIYQFGPTNYAESRNGLPCIWRLGCIYTGESYSLPSAWHQDVIDTLRRHGNFDYATANVVWDPSIDETNLPPSLYLKEKPSWFGDSLDLPLIGPDVPGLTKMIPAQGRFFQHHSSFRPLKPTGIQVIESK